jgi:catechol 2,3-dioxygenase-like lactoylglutathione lyase family enzyme
MLKQLTHITILVKDQEQALNFYTKKLGFQVHTDAQFGGMRWLTVNPINLKDMEFCLLIPETQEGLAQIGKQGGNFGIGCLSTDDAQAEYERLKAAGVDMVSEPVTEPWGTGFTFKDLYGNIFYVNQPPK